MFHELPRSVALLLMTLILLTGCVTKQQQRPAHVELIRPNEATQPPLPIPKPQIVPQLPKFKTINWDVSVQPLVSQMLHSVNSSSNSLLMVDCIKNSTNGTLQKEKATNAIQNALVNNGKFTLVTNDQLAQTRQMLGLSTNDSFHSRSKAIGLARTLKAQYVLYSTVQGDAKTPTLQMQLMSVKTGEIIWSSQGVVTLN